MADSLENIWYSDFISSPVWITFGILDDILCFIHDSWYVYQMNSSHLALFSNFLFVGNDDIFRSDLNYWLIVGCGTVIIPVVLSPFTVLLSVFSTSLVGSYCVIFGLDRFMGGSLAFIVINVFKRALFDEIYRASNHAPFQTKGNHPHHVIRSHHQ